jgi:hypothetical protein
MRKSKDWLARYQDYVSEWSNISTRISVSWRSSNFSRFFMDIRSLELPNVELSLQVASNSSFWSSTKQRNKLLENSFRSNVHEKSTKVTATSIV